MGRAATAALVLLLSVVTCHRDKRPAEPVSACPTGAEIRRTEQGWWCVLDDREAQVRQGPAVFVHVGGAVRSKGEYQHDEKHGEWSVWDTDGELIQRQRWDKGVLVEQWVPPLNCPPGTTANGAAPPTGQAIWCQRLGSDGRWINDGAYVSWYPTGELLARGVYENGREQGVQLMWYPDGFRKAVTTYRLGVRDGHAEAWHPNGRPFIQATFANGDEEGPWVSFWEEGTRSAEGAFVVGREQGPWRFWYPSGELAATGEYVRGKKLGWWRGWDSEGNEQPMSEYRDGVEVSTGSREGEGDRPKSDSNSTRSRTKRRSSAQ